MIIRLFLLLAMMMALLAGASCGDDIGEFCSSHNECGSDAFCCTEGKCGGGMCTYECNSDRDCPSDMRCRDKKYCLFSCSSDRDCHPAFKCDKNLCVGD